MNESNLILLDPVYGPGLTLLAKWQSHPSTSDRIGNFHRSQAVHNRAWLVQSTVHGGAWMHDSDTSPFASDFAAAMTDQEFLVIGFCALTGFSVAALFYGIMAWV